MPVTVTGQRASAPSFISTAARAQSGAPDLRGAAQGLESIGDLLLAQRQRRERSQLVKEVANFRIESNKSLDEAFEAFDGSTNDFVTNRQSEFDQRVKAFTDRIGNDRINNRFLDLIQQDKVQFLNRAQGFETQKTQEFILRNAGETARGIINSVANDPARESDARDELEGLAETLPGAVRGRFLSEGNTSVTEGVLDGRRRADPYGLKREIEEGAFNSLATPEQLERARSAVDTEIRRREAAADRENAQARAVRAIQLSGLVDSDLASRAQTGQGVDGLDINEMVDVLGERRTAQYFQNRQLADETFEAVDGFANQSPQDIARRLDDLAPRAGSANFAQQQKVFDLARREASNQLQARAQDPAAYYQNSDNGARLTYETYKQALSQDPALAGSVFGAYADRQIALQEAGGIGAPRLLPQAEASSIAAGIVEGPPEERAQRLRNLTESLETRYGKHADDVLSELVDAGLPDTAYVLRSISDNRAAATVMAQALDQHEAVKKLISTGDARDTRNKVAREIEPLIETLIEQPNGAEISTAYSEAISATAEYLVAREGLSPNKAAKRAAKTFNDAYTFVDQYRVPSQYNARAVERGAGVALNNLLADNGAGLAPAVTNLPMDDAQKRLLAADTVKNASSWVTNEDETGLVLLDDLGRPILDASGDPIQASFDDLASMGEGGGIIDLPFNF